MVYEYKQMKKEKMDEHIKEEVLQLLHMDRELSKNKISDNCQYIYSETDNSEENLMIKIRVGPGRLIAIGTILTKLTEPITGSISRSVNSVMHWIKWHFLFIFTKILMDPH